MGFFFKFRLHVFASLLLLYCMYHFEYIQQKKHHCYSGCQGQLQGTVTAGHCWGRRPLLQWMSGTVTENCYCCLQLRYERTVTVDIWHGYRELLPLVTAGVGDHCYSGCLGQLQRSDRHQTSAETVLSYPSIDQQ